jgi:hypothetical protein
MLRSLQTDVPVFQLLFVVIGNRPKIRHKNIIPLLLGQVCRPNAAFAGTKYGKP